MPRRLIALIWMGLPLLLLCGRAEPGKKPAAEKDYAAELPRIAPKEPRDALKTL
jgi:hypothetical protein